MASKYWLSVVILLLISGCSTPMSKGLDSVQVGMNRAAVLEAAGNPKFTQRAQSQDTWVYAYFEGEQEYRRPVIFVDGKVTEIGTPRPHPDPEKDLKKAATLEEYEAAGKKHKKSKKDEDFKDVKGGE